MKLPNRCAVLTLTGGGKLLIGFLFVISSLIYICWSVLVTVMYTSMNARVDVRIDVLDLGVD